MSRIHIKEFSKEQGQTKAAELLGLTQGALNKAIRVGRDIYVTKKLDGSYAAEEVRPFPSQSSKKTEHQLDCLGELSAQTGLANS